GRGHRRGLPFSLALEWPCSGSKLRSFEEDRNFFGGGGGAVAVLWPSGHPDAILFSWCDGCSVDWCKQEGM
uniref:Uncharacterized protein n=1 Tax=Oryza brachyantha TaxID=4533 RepID=J3N2H9_ORYBR